MKIGAFCIGNVLDEIILIEQMFGHILTDK